MSKNKQQKQINQVSGVGAQLRQAKGIEGLMTCVFNHTTVPEKLTADFEWHGEPLNFIWPKVLAFLKWTYDEFKSESQLRLFVNKNTGYWEAWAFPQKARTGMSAKEITEQDDKDAYEKTKLQRAKFPDTEGWYYWGTVHHHCSTSAFQSGTDQDNERNQDGVHITVGNLDKNQYDIHFRIYVSGIKLSSITPLDFWDIGDELNTVPEKFRHLLPANTAELLAKQQMGIPAPAGTEFPQEWRENIIDVTPKSVMAVNPSRVTTLGDGVVSGGSSQGGFFGRTYTEKSKPNLQWDLGRAYGALLAFLHQQEEKPNASIVTMEIALQVLDSFEQAMDDETMDLFAICVGHDVMPGNLVLHCEEMIAAAELREQQREQSRMEHEGGSRPPLGINPPTNHNAGMQKHWYFGQD